MSINEADAKTTACQDCVHYLGVNRVNADTWYNHLCQASPLKLKFDPITGKYETPYPKYAYCRDINLGQCKKFAPK